MACVYRKRGYWYVAYRTPSGWKRESLRTRKKRAAEKALPRFQRIEDSDSPAESSRVSLADLVAYYLEYRRKRLSESSFRSQEKYRVPKFVGFLADAGVRMLDQVTERHVETYIELLTKSCSPSYVRSTLCLIGLMLRTACGWGMLAGDPSHDVRSPRVPDLTGDGTCGTWRWLDAHGRRDGPRMVLSVEGGVSCNMERIWRGPCGPHGGTSRAGHGCARWLRERLAGGR